MLSVSGEKMGVRDQGTRTSARANGATAPLRLGVRLPDGADADNTQARFEDGVLTIAVPKAPESAGKSNRITIQQT